MASPLLASFASSRRRDSVDGHARAQTSPKISWILPHLLQTRQPTRRGRRAVRWRSRHSAGAMPGQARPGSGASRETVGFPALAKRWRQNQPGRISHQHSEGDYAPQIPAGDLQGEPGATPPEMERLGSSTLQGSHQHRTRRVRPLPGRSGFTHCSGGVAPGYVLLPLQGNENETATSIAGEKCGLTASQRAARGRTGEFRVHGIGLYPPFPLAYLAVKRIPNGTVSHIR